MSSSSKLGGAIFTQKYMEVRNCTFMYNNAPSAGGALFSTGSALIVDSLFVNNSATLGGAISSEGFSVMYRIVNSKFIGNVAARSGGAVISGTSIRRNRYFHSLSDHAVEGCEFLFNQANTGGAVELREDRSVIDSCFFSGNQAFGSGGAVTAFRPAALQNCTFYQNTAVSGGGGAVFSNADALFVADCLFHSNLASIDGGALFSVGILNVTSSNFTRNFGALCGGAMSILSGAASVVSSIFDENFSHSGGAACSSSSLTVESSAFNCNHGTYGGGIQVNALSQNSFTSCTFRNNTAEEGGAAAVITTAFFSSCTFSGNFANQSGGAVSNRGNVSILSSTFEYNRAQERGGAADSEGGSLNLTEVRLGVNYALIKGSLISLRNGALGILFRMEVDFDSTVLLNTGGVIPIMVVLSNLTVDQVLAKSSNLQTRVIHHQFNGFLSVISSVLSGKSFRIAI